MYKFAAASENESIVFGAARPGYRNQEVNEWIKFMQNQGIQKVCCLLSQSQLTRYSDLTEVYKQTFGVNQVLWAPIEDFLFADIDVLLHQILPFLAAADNNNKKIVVYCSGGIGRTGHILAAWLIAGRGFSKQGAIAAVKKTGRNPYEAVIVAPFKGRTPWQAAAELDRLLNACS